MAINAAMWDLKNTKHLSSIATQIQMHLHTQTYIYIYPYAQEYTINDYKQTLKFS